MLPRLVDFFSYFKLFVCLLLLLYFNFVPPSIMCLLLSASFVMHLFSKNISSRTQSVAACISSIKLIRSSFEFTFIIRSPANIMWLIFSPFMSIPLPRHSIVLNAYTNTSVNKFGDILSLCHTLRSSLFF